MRPRLRLADQEEVSDLGFCLCCFLGLVLCMGSAVSFA